MTELTSWLSPTAAGLSLVPVRPHVPRAGEPPEFGTKWRQRWATDDAGRKVLRYWQSPPSWPSDVPVPLRQVSGPRLVPKRAEKTPSWEA